MKFDRKDLITGFIVLAILAGGYYWLKKSEPTTTPAPTPKIEDKIEDSFKVNIPEDVDKVELKDLTGKGVSALATKKFANKKFESMVLADLPDPDSGKFYQAWLVKDTNYVSMGKMRVAKGGWISEFQSSTDYSSYKKVVVSLETKFDQTPEEIILEGTFAN